MLKSYEVNGKTPIPPQWPPCPAGDDNQHCDTQLATL